MLQEPRIIEEEMEIETLPTLESPDRAPNLTPLLYTERVKLAVN